MDKKDYDVVIVGLGPAAMSAGTYAVRYGLSTACVGQIPGGQMSEATVVQNWPGTPDITGMELSKKMIESTQNCGAQIIYDLVEDISKQDGAFTIKTSISGEISAKAIILATGTHRRKLSISGEDKFLGRGVNYCATCDGPLYKGRVATVIGGGNSAFGAAIYLSNICAKTYLLVREEKARADQSVIDQAGKQSNLEIHYGVNALELKGEVSLQSILLSKEINGSNELFTDGVFVEIGSIPSKEIPQKLGIDLNDHGYIKIDWARKTNVPGIFAAGDCADSNHGVKQIVTAVGDGAVAANSAFEFIKGAGV